MYSAKGHSLLETMLVCAGIAASMAMLAALFASSSGAGGRLRTWHRLEKGGLVLTTVVNDAILEYDRHPLQLHWRIHPQGAVQLADGAPNSVMQGRHAPKPDSAALTSFDAMVDPALDVMQASLLGDQSQFRVCRRYSAAGTALRLPRNYLGLGIGLNIEYALPGKKEIVKHGRCFELRLRRVQGMLAALPATNDELPLVLLPLRRIYTTYLDRSGVLRYLGHSGSRNLENQPLLKLPKSAVLDFSERDFDGLRELTIVLTDPSGYALTANLSSHWAKGAPVNFILNRP